MSTKKLVISTYLQYILLALGALLLFTFFRQPGGVLLTFSLTVVLAYVLNPLMRQLEGWRLPRVMSATLRAVPETIRDQTVELFHTVENTLIKYIKAQLLLRAIMGAIGPLTEIAVYEKPAGLRDSAREEE